MCKCRFEIIGGREMFVYHGPSDYSPGPVSDTERALTESDVSVENQEVAVDSIEVSD